MPTPNSDLIRRLEEQERALVLDRFDQDDAWTLGHTITEQARKAGHAVLVDIRRPNLVLFRAALPGTTADQEVWAARKAATVLRMEASSALVAARMEAAGVDPAAIGWLDSGYAMAGGSFPVRVAGTGVVAAVTASGLTSEQDHDLVAAGLEALIAAHAR